MENLPSNRDNNKTNNQKQNNIQVVKDDGSLADIQVTP